MLVRVITSLLVMSLLMSGCGYQDLIAELESELTQKDEELQSTQDALKETQSTLKEQADELSQLREDLAMLQDEAARSQVARGELRAELVPNPVLPDDKGMWMYRAYVSAGSVRVRLTLVVIRRYWEGHP